MSFIIQFTAHFRLMIGMNARLWCCHKWAQPRFSGVAAALHQFVGEAQNAQSAFISVHIHRTRCVVNLNIADETPSILTLLLSDLARWTAARGLMGADQRSSDRLVSHARGSARLVALHA